MILGLENRPQTVSQLASQSHMFYVSGGKSIDKNISLSYWFVIDYCFLVTQWLMITLFFGPEGHVSYSLTFLHVWEYNKAGLDSVSAPSPWSSVGPLILGAVLVPWSSLFTDFLCLVSHSPTLLRFRKPCLSSWSRHFRKICICIKFLHFRAENRTLDFFFPN